MQQMCNNKNNNKHNNNKNNFTTQQRGSHRVINRKSKGKRGRNDDFYLVNYANLNCN